MKSELLAALIHEPNILFLDEPTLGLDINAQRNLRKFLQKYNKETNATICLTSHYMKDITSLCKRVICVQEGSLSYDGELDLLLRKLSLGQRMKSELLAALIHEPKILFLDEPTLGLDINAQRNLRKFLKKYNKETNATICLTSHYMKDITSLCKRVICVHELSLIHI